MPGALDTNGVYQPAEDDLIASPTYTGYLKKISQSISDVFSSHSHAEFTWVVTAGASATVTPVALPAIDAARSKAGAAAQYVAQAGGIKLVRAGRYIISVSAEIAAASATRTFLEVVADGQTSRIGFPAGEDRGAVTANGLGLAANANVVVNVFQASGAARSWTGRIRVDYLGPL